MDKLRVHVLNKKVGKIRKETRDGRKKIIVPSATLPDDVVMNGILYPADEIAASYKALEGTPAPLGHPNLHGKFCPANHTEAFIRYSVGAYNENVRRENGRVWMDKVIDVEYAQQSEKGRALLNAIEKGEPIHSSTGLVCMIDNSSGKKVARSILWDHDAILLNETGAATPEQGVGLLVNAATDHGDEIDVMNSMLEDAERELDWAVDRAAHAAERVARIPLIERIKQMILGEVSNDQEPLTNQEEEDAMTVSAEQFKALSDKVDSLSTTVGGIGASVTEAVNAALKPVLEAQERQAATNAAAEEAEKADLVQKLVNAKAFDEEVANELSLPSLRKEAAKLSQKSERRQAAPIVGGGFKTATNSAAGGFKLPE